jgi:deoxyadenosine/deoxycytidine kinase
MIKIVSIEGNIGSGKSTLLENLKNHYKNNANVIFLKEPVDDWEKIKDSQGNTMLQKFYADQEKYSFAFQMMAYISRLKILKDAVQKIKDRLESTNLMFRSEEPTYIIITERSLYTDKHVFAKMLYDQGKIEDVCYQIYLNWFDAFTKEYPVDLAVYVSTEPQNCYDRVHKRARVGEEVIPLTYLEECHKYHDDFLSKCQPENKLVLDGNVDIFENEKIVETWLEQINTFIDNTV